MYSSTCFTCIRVKSSSSSAGAASHACLLPVLPPGGVQALDDAGGVAEDHGVAGGARHHAEHGQPQVRHVLWGEPAVADAEHVGHGLEESPGVLLEPPGVLQGEGCHER